MRHLLDIFDLTTDEIYELIKKTEDIMNHPNYYLDACHGKILGKLFFEPSTRTCNSFESAIQSLGGGVVGFSDPNNSSVVKGECLIDTVRTVSSYSDVIVIRHPQEGAPKVASQVSVCPVINAGDGGHHHPSQTLTDLFTIYKEKGGFDGLTIGLCGDLKYGRTVHSLISGLSRYKNIKLVLISPNELKVPEYEKKEVMDKSWMKYVETTSLEEAIPELDVLYMTRIQRERFSDEKIYERLKDSYILNKEKLNSAKNDMIVMHPLPRVNEISLDVDDDRRAKYFDQVRNGRYVRMALIMKLLSDMDVPDKKQDESSFRHDLKCNNPRCISSTEKDIKSAFRITDNGRCRCIYCDKEVAV